jgi:hypothetical protein
MSDKFGILDCASFGSRSHSKGPFFMRGAIAESGHCLARAKQERRTIANWPAAPVTG